MGRVVHFEFHVDNMDRAKIFYGNVFDWKFEDWSEYAGMPYFGVTTGDNQELGINGALMQRQSAPPALGQGVNSAVCTMGVENYDETAAKILENGGQVAMPKYALPGMAWQGYFIDTENNIFGLHQPDPNAK
ncbi:VOC family protein [Solibacillus sp. FSL K6-1523]|uniref:VOC family protein n=1 Tax=Solibacillus sp. FSL K6-1523 TaxID=2921471 RepID=UPI0030F56BA3